MKKTIIISAATFMFAVATFAQTVPQTVHNTITGEKVKIDMTAYIKSYTSAANDVGTMMSKFALFSEKQITAKEVLDFYNSYGVEILEGAKGNLQPGTRTFAQMFGKAITVAQAEKLVRQKGFAFMEAEALVVEADELIKKANSLQQQKN